MAINDIVQTIAEARVDARSLSDFVFKPAGFKVARRLAPPVDTLQFYINRFNNLNGDFSSSVSIALSSLNNSVAEADGKVAYIETTVQDAINQSILSSGFVTIDSFEAGATITQRNQALRHAADGKLYRWAGDLPKIVPAGSTPESSGGIGANAWLEVSDTTLRFDITTGGLITDAVVSLPNGRNQQIKNSLSTEIINNVMQLREFNPANAISVKTKCHTVTGFGAASYTYNASNTLDADNNGSIIRSNVAVGAWELAHNNAFTIEQFGAYDGNDAASNAEAIRLALLAAQDNAVVNQESKLIASANVAVVSDVKNASINLNLKYEGDNGKRCVSLTSFTASYINISIGCSNAHVNGLYLERCTGSTVPLSASIHSIYATSGNPLAVCSGVFTRDSDNTDVFARVDNVVSDGSRVVRGVMVSDQTITKNTSLISPRVTNILCPADAVVFDADGVYVEHSNSDHEGGIRVTGGDYRNCSKRFIKVNMPNPIIKDNIGVTDTSEVSMFSFVASFDGNAGTVSDNQFSTTGSNGCGKALEAGVTNEELVIKAFGNNFSSSNTMNSSIGFSLTGKFKDVQIGVGTLNGFSCILQQYGNTSDVEQSLTLTGGVYDNLGSTFKRNGIALVGDYTTANIDGITCKNPVATSYFVSAPNISPDIISCTNNKHSYSYGAVFGKRVLNLNNKDSASLLYIQGKAYLRSNSLPTTREWRVGDVVEAINITTHIGWVCTTAGAGSDAVWKKYGAIEAI